MMLTKTDEAALLATINDGRDALSLPLRRLWDAICISPEVWTLTLPSGKETGAWVVAIIGKQVIWYDDIFDEMYDGFHTGNYDAFGEIAGTRDGLDGRFEPAIRTLQAVIGGFESR